MSTSKEYNQQEQSWIQMYGKDRNLWISDVSEYPSIVAYEYYNLQKQCSNNQIYGALICMKDNFEALLKMEVLLCFAWAEKNTEEDFQQDTISQLTTPNLSLGAWLELAAILMKALKKREITIPAEFPLEYLMKQYKSLGIVNWRNRKIGHGAMELDDDEEFRLEIREKILELKEILQNVDGFLRKQKLYVGKVCLEGPRMARELEVDGQVFCELTDCQYRFCVDPYLIICKHERKGKGLYFFDNQKTTTLTTFQSYSDGAVTNNYVPYFAHLRKCLDDRGYNRFAEPDDPYLDEAEERELDLLQMSHSYVPMPHLENWLKECIQKHSRGIFYLQMNRGMGKSVFTEKLDRMYQKPVIIDENLDVRTYHFNRSQLVGADDFTRKVEWQWANQYGNAKSWQRIPHIMDYEREGLSTAKSMCRFLEEVRRYSEWNRGADRILMILDGLDEIMDADLWNYIPASELLPEGVFILLTSRPASTVDLKISRKRLKIAETLSVQEDAIWNHQFLKSYIKNSGIKNVNNQLMEQILAYSDNRVLYLGLICKLLTLGIRPEQLSDVHSIVHLYLSILDQYYGEKEGIRVREILAVLSTLGSMESLTLKQIGDLTTEGKVTLGLIGMIRDLAPMLKIERSRKGNKYSVSTSDLAEELRKQVPETEDAIQWMIQLGLNQIQNGYPVESIGVVPVLEHIVELALLSGKSLSSLGDKDLFKKQYDEFTKLFEKEFEDDDCFQGSYVKRSWGMIERLDREYNFFQQSMALWDADSDSGFLPFN